LNTVKRREGPEREACAHKTSRHGQLGPSCRKYVRHGNSVHARKIDARKSKQPPPVFALAARLWRRMQTVARNCIPFSTAGAICFYPLACFHGVPVLLIGFAAARIS
jgi:hypothetical protein